MRNLSIFTRARKSAKKGYKCGNNSTLEFDMNKLHELFPMQSCVTEEEGPENVVRLEKFEREAADSRELCEFISEMAFDLALMSRKAGMNGVAQMLSLAALEVGLSQNN